MKTVRITTGHSWYTDMVGQEVPVQEETRMLAVSEGTGTQYMPQFELRRGNWFVLIDCRHAHIINE